MNYQSTLSDEQLIQFFLHGDPKAMAILIELYKDRIYSSIYGIIHDKNKSEEIFYAVFVKLIDSMIAGKTLDEGKFLPWAMQVAHGLCIQHNHNNLTINGQHNEVLTANRGMTGSMISGTNSFDNHLRIRNLIDQLPDKQREVLVLNHYSGLRFKEIAELLKCSVTTALESMHAALRNLGKLMVENEVYC